MRSEGALWKRHLPVRLDWLSSSQLISLNFRPISVLSRVSLLSKLKSILKILSPRLMDSKNLTTLSQKLMLLKISFMISLTSDQIQTDMEDLMLMVSNHMVDGLPIVLSNLLLTLDKTLSQLSGTLSM